MFNNNSLELSEASSESGVLDLGPVDRKDGGYASLMHSSEHVGFKQLHSEPSRRKQTESIVYSPYILSLVIGWGAPESSTG